MNTTQDDGGPAFPESASGPYQNGEIVPGRPGMSLRDWFAGMALQGIISKTTSRTVELDVTEHEEQAARGAYGYADAMLAARKEKP